MGLSIDELLAAQGREPVFKYALGKHLDNTLNILGFENPNKDITEYKTNMKTLKYRYNKFSDLSKDLKEIDSICEQ